MLSDNEKRSLYDRFGEAGLQGEYGGTGFHPDGVRNFNTSKFGIFFFGVMINEMVASCSCHIYLSDFANKKMIKLVICLYY